MFSLRHCQDQLVLGSFCCDPVAIFARDIEPRGFYLPTIDGFVTRQVVEEVRRLLEDDEYRFEITDRNYELARKFFSYDVARRKLSIMIANVLGD